jgi:hypothetical protein
MNEKGEKELEKAGIAIVTRHPTPNSDMMSASRFTCDFESDLERIFILILYQFQFFCKVFENVEML